MGFGKYETYRMTFYRTNLVFEGNPYLVDPLAMMDMQLAGMDIPSQTINALQSGFIDIWLIPKGDDPFTLRNWYNKKFIFDDRFRKSFLDSYRLADRSRFFDLWYFKAEKPGTHF